MANKGTQAYNFEIYEPTIIPQEVPASKILGPNHIVKPKKKTIIQERLEAKIVNHRIYKCLLPGAVLFMLFLAIVTLESNRLMVDLEKNALNDELEAQISEGVRINAELSKKMPISEVEKYAIEHLGMVKVSRSQIFYVNTNDSDSATYYEKIDKQPRK